MEKEIGSILAYNSLGALVLSKKMDVGQTTQEIDVQNLSSGIYFLQWVNKKGETSFIDRIVK